AGSSGGGAALRSWWALWLQGRRRKRIAAVPAVPVAPSSLDALDNGILVQLTWQDLSSNEQGFRVYRKVDGGSFGLWRTLGANIVTTQDTGVSVGHFYAYYVTAYNAVGESGPSNTVSFVFGA